GTSVHSGSRAMVFDSNGDILEADEGGLYRLKTPGTAATRIWSSLNGNLAISEFNSVAYDDINKTVFGAAYNVGVSEQGTTNSSTWTSQPYWQGNGSVAAVDNGSTAGQSVHYGSLSGLTNLHRRTYDSAGNLKSDQTATLLVVGQAGKNLAQFEASAGGVIPA